MVAAPKKLRIDEIDELLREGLTGSQIAKQLNVTQGYISQVKKQLQATRATHLQLERAGEITNKHINAADAILDLHRAAKKILNKLLLKIDGKDDHPDLAGFKFEGKKDVTEVAQRYMQEIRSQIDLSMRIYRQLYDMKTVADFQDAVLKAIGRASPEVKEEVIKELKKARAMRPNITF